MAQWPLIPIGFLAGLVGSIIDSILGATVQYSGFDIRKQKVVNQPGDPDQVLPISGLNILSNNQVNFVSASLTALLTAKIAVSLF